MRKLGERRNLVGEFLPDGEESAFYGQESIDDVGIELRAAAAQDQASGLAVRERVLVNAPRRQSIVNVGQCNNPAAERNRVACQAVRIPRPVISFVMGNRNVAGHAQEGRIGIP